jgi:hypothetical protein
MAGGGVPSTALMDVRKAKSSQKLSLRTSVRRLTIEDVPAQLDALRRVASDLRDAGVISDLVLQESSQRSVTVDLAPAES